MRVRHISFDVWNTLIRPHPDFGPRRSRFVAAALDRDVEEVVRIHRAVKDGLDARAESHGEAVTADEAFRILLARLAAWRQRPAIPALRAGYEAIFELLPPRLAPEAKETVHALVSRGYTVSLGSNTNFLGGKVLREFLTREGLEFQFTLFSDQIGCSKPHPNFFSAVLDHARFFHDDIQPSEILHVGDNRVCDGGGASKAGMQYHIVTGPEDMTSVLQHGGLHEDQS